MVHKIALGTAGDGVSRPMSLASRSDAAFDGGRRFATLRAAYGSVIGRLGFKTSGAGEKPVATLAASEGRPAVAAITGAGSGIGRALAVELANRGYALALADYNESGLMETVRLIGERTTVSPHVVDVAQRSAVDAFAADVVALHGGVDLLINNAGVALAGDVAELTVEEIAWLMDINFWGTVYGVKAFLPALQRSGAATIVNLSSVFGLVAPPGQAAYAASKFAIRGFTESLREELRGTVHVLTVHPGGIKTNIARASRIAAAADQDLHRERAADFEKRMLTQTPERAARLIVRGIERRKDRVLIGADAVRLDVIARLAGPGAARLIAKAAARNRASFVRVETTAPLSP